ncbi:hypothetical protein [Novosphingobium sp. PC22D]|uniref:hypothetical protein n=1 Tax=Novosphingobium sp. PC22D TaxID=1962403 RepID=UPI0011453AF2|nr:hypothetical protein [Novosphingobium sp. PC22D]
MSEKTEQNEQLLELPVMYFNGFQLGLSNADVNGILLLNNQPSAAISMSYTTAKTLAEALNQMVDTLEKVTGREIMTTKQVAEGLENLNATKGKNDGQPH